MSRPATRKAAPKGEYIETVCTSTSLITSMHLRILNLYFSHYQVEEAKFMTMPACIYHFLTFAAMKPFHRFFGSYQRLFFIQPIYSVCLSSYIPFWVGDAIILPDRISYRVLTLSSN